MLKMANFLLFPLQNQRLYIHNMLFYHMQAYIQSDRQHKVLFPLLHCNPNCKNRVEGKKMRENKKRKEKEKNSREKKTKTRSTKEE
jgi:hypothetical protein